MLPLATSGLLLVMSSLNVFSLQVLPSSHDLNLVILRGPTCGATLLICVVMAFSNCVAFMSEMVAAITASSNVGGSVCTTLYEAYTVQVVHLSRLSKLLSPCAARGPVPMVIRIASTGTLIASANLEWTASFTASVVIKAAGLLTARNPT